MEPIPGVTTRLPQPDICDSQPAEALKFADSKPEKLLRVENEVNWMHEAYWGLTESPFALTPDPRFYYMGHAAEDSLMMLHYALVRNKGVAMVTAPLGMGKTALCHKITSLLDPTITRVINVVNPTLTPLQFHFELLAELGVKTRYKDRQAVSKELQQRLFQVYEKGKRVVLIVDDAHMIESAGTLEELRALVNFQSDNQFLVNMLLVGQPQLTETLKKNPALDQTIAIRERIQPLSLVDTGELVMHRLRTAGYSGDQGIFATDAMVELHRRSKGVPRVICHIADRALWLGKSQRARFVDGLLMHDAVADFYGVEEAA